MIFSAPTFLFLFLPVVLGVYLACPRRARNGCLLAASVVFYAWGEQTYVVVLLASVVANHLFGRWVAAARTPRTRTAALATAVFCNLAVLAWFKYAAFLAGSVGSLVAVTESLSRLEAIHLPLGISFFTFQGLSYVVDVYRAPQLVERKMSRVGLYITMFPQLVAGPIVRFHDVAEALAARESRLADVAAGLRRFVVGLAKKVLVANVVARAADGAFAVPGGDLTPGLAWLGIVAYTIQIYFDFSGYSDMAIGLARVFGFRLRENFDHPYVSRSITEFWRRWHISLSSWFRDYLYLPLGGNRRGTLRTYVNLWIVFVLCGLWHGASWTFVLWGVYHGTFLVLERMLGLRERGIGRLGTLLIVMVGWVLFRAESLGYAWTFTSALAGVAAGDGLRYHAWLFLDTKMVLALLVGIVGSMPVLPAVAAGIDRIAERLSSSTRRLQLEITVEAARLACLVALLVGSAARVVSGTHDPFIYFRF